MVGTGVIPGGSVQFGESGAHSIDTPDTGIRQSGCSHSRGLSASSSSRRVYWNLSTHDEMRGAGEGEDLYELHVTPF